MGKIRWANGYLGQWHGYVNGDKRHKYFVGYEQRGKPMIADVRPNPETNLMWEGIDILIASVEDGFAWCEMVEATGAYD